MEINDIYFGYCQHPFGFSQNLNDEYQVLFGLKRGNIGKLVNQNWLKVLLPGKQKV